MIYPFNDAAIKDPSVSYAASESLLAGEFLWTEMEGTADSLSPILLPLWIMNYHQRRKFIFNWRMNPF